MTVFLRTMTHVGFFCERTEGALVFNRDEVLFVWSGGYFRVNAVFVEFHDAKMEELAHVAK